MGAGASLSKATTLRPAAVLGLTEVGVAATDGNVSIPLETAANLGSSEKASTSTGFKFEPLGDVVIQIRALAGAGDGCGDDATAPCAGVLLVRVLDLGSYFRVKFEPLRVYI